MMLAAAVLPCGAAKHTRVAGKADQAVEFLPACFPRPGPSPGAGGGEVSFPLMAHESLVAFSWDTRPEGIGEQTRTSTHLERLVAKLAAVDHHGSHTCS
jgi:hypothetical protein